MSFAIKIDDFVVEVYDYVIFSTGDFPNSVEMLKLTGSNVPIKMLVWTASIWVTFKSDSSVSYKGFSFLISHLSDDETG